MLGLPLAFTVPFALAALAILPALYVLLRVTPPRPERVPFPPLRLILDLKPREETPATTPWWLLLLRLVIAAAVILAMAGPIWNPQRLGSPGRGPLLLAIDDGWAAAPTWDRRMTAAAQRIEAARASGRPVAVVPISDAGRTIVAGDAAAALDRLRAVKPQPFEPDRAPTAAAITRFGKATADTSVVWLADGLESGGAAAFARALNDGGLPVVVVADDRPVLALADPRNSGGSLAVRVMRSAAGAGQAERGRVRALDSKGLTIGEAPYVFRKGDETDAAFDLPTELRNEMSRLEIEGEHSAGAVSLLDARWRRRTVGIVSGDSADTDQPLLAPSYYLRKALLPYADVREPKPGAPDPVGAMLDEHVSVLVLADLGTLPAPTRVRLGQWVEGGGLLLRFAGTRLSGGGDDLVPVRLRQGGRVLGGSLSWEQPKALAPFEPPSPFVGLAVPKEVTVSRQVLAEPEPGLTAKTWAQLADGTPLVTAAARGKGRVVLFHVTADTTWSSLPISGLFVEMLKRIVALSGQPPRQDLDRDEAQGAGTIAGVGEATGADAAGVGPAAPRATETAAPSRTLDGFGVLGPPPATAKPVPLDFSGAASADHPPGFYGQGDAAVAVPTLLPADHLAAADLGGTGFERAPLQAAEPVDLRPALIALAFALFLADSLAALWLAGKLGLPKRLSLGSLRRGTAAMLVLAALATLPLPAGSPARAEMSLPPPAAAAPPAPIRISPSDLASALSVRLAYVESGDGKVDETSRQGLETLSQTLAGRTSLTPGDPVGIDPAKDELAFYPLLYWPIVASKPQPSREATEKIAAYMRQGGTILFDTRDALTARAGEPSAEASWLRQLLSNVSVPELEPVPPDHVVTKTFYLLDNFVGRYSTGRTWIEALPPPSPDGTAHPARSGDGVSPIVLTSNDLAAGWAGDSYGEALYPLVPGDPRQHEMALRGGVNLVMYTLTGNYKADQVHVRDLLERLGH